MIARPPFEAGADQLTRADPSAGVATAPVGAPGTVAGITGAEAAEAGPVPTTFAAVTLNVYDVPLVRPLTVQLRAPPVVQVFAPGAEVTV